MAKRSEPILVVKLSKGLADRKRLPLLHVLRVLDEVRQMITDVGRELQWQKGHLQPSGDFGLELLAGTSGVIVRRGSILATIALTQNVALGILAAQQVVKTIDLLETEELAGIDPRQQVDTRIIRRLSRISRIQRTDKTEMEITLKQHGKTVTARFGETAVAAVRTLQAPTFTVESVPLFGKIFELLDRDPSDEESERGFWGELRRENGEVWRLQFDPSLLSQVAPLFRKQVRVEGTAIYYRVASPKLLVQHIEPEKDRDYVAAFDELVGCYKSVYKTDFGTLLKIARGED